MIGKLSFPLLMLALIAKVSARGFQQNSTATCASTPCKDFHKKRCDVSFIAKHWNDDSHLTDAQKDGIAQKMSCARNMDPNLTPNVDKNSVLFNEYGFDITWVTSEDYYDVCELTIADDIWTCVDVPETPTNLDVCIDGLRTNKKCHSCRTRFPTHDYYLVRAAKNNGHFYYDRVERRIPGSEPAEWVVFDSRNCK